ncbi:MAG: tetratricopeptide repeat protein [Rivularia sp. (in: Bacteria)]|nr:tetratricopeptide repeat protein [Rivularia sp. MS3]
MATEDNQEFYPEIDDISYSRILELSKQGDSYAKRKAYAKAIDTYYEALDLVPEPSDSEVYTATNWLLNAIAEAYLLSGDYENARIVINQAMRDADGTGNPFSHLILGKAQFKLGDLDRAEDNLALAYIGGGKEIFEGDDPKYYEYLKTLMRDMD